MIHATLVIMAAGDSLRFCHDTYIRSNTTSLCATKKPFTKKQWLRINTMPLWLYVTHSLTHTILKCTHDMHFHQKNESEKDRDIAIHLDKAIIVASKVDEAYMQKLAPESLYFSIPTSMSHNDTNLTSQALQDYTIPVQVVCGGTSRFESLKNAIQYVDSDIVIVNDCARFNIKKEVLYNMLQKFTQTQCDCVAPYLPVSDTILYHNAISQGSDNTKQNYSHLCREHVALIQTPQISKTKKLKESFTLNTDYTDETSAICALKDAHLELVLGSKDMAKITFQEDRKILQNFIESLSPYPQTPNSYNNSNTNHLYIGQGIDIHAFEDSKTMWLCGVQIESDFGFKAHSDGDVGIHAIIDSILGAMSGGDIGEMFPDTDMAYSNIDSKILLKRVYDYCFSVGLEIVNIDVTILAQTPRIAPYKNMMQQCLADILYLNKSQINIKATTTEKLGFIGRKEGVMVQSITQLQLREI